MRARFSPKRAATTPAGSAPSRLPIPNSDTMSAASGVLAPNSWAVRASSGVAALIPVSDRAVGRYTDTPMRRQSAPDNVSGPLTGTE